MARRYGTGLTYGSDVFYGEPINPYAEESPSATSFGPDSGEFGDGTFGQYAMGYGAAWTTPTFTTESPAATTYTEE